MELNKIEGKKDVKKPDENQEEDIIEDEKIFNKVNKGLIIFDFK